MTVLTHRHFGGMHAKMVAVDNASTCVHNKITKQKKNQERIIRTVTSRTDGKTALFKQKTGYARADLFGVSSILYVYYGRDRPGRFGMVTRECPNHGPDSVWEVFQTTTASLNR